MFKRIAVILKMVKFQHTIFSLPFGVVSAFYAIKSVNISTTEILIKFAWILIAVISARLAAMTFNRMVDMKFDAANPRTSDRAIPAKTVSLRFAVTFTIFTCALFVFAGYQLNTLCFYLSPLALFIILGYSYTKRFTPLCHCFLGLSLSGAPLGAWIAIKGNLELFPIILSIAVILWVTGFDIIYAMLDAEFDANAGLYSIPARFGMKKSLFLSTLFHCAAVAVFVVLGVIAKLGIFYFIGLGLATTLIIYQHIIVEPSDPKKINQAFFVANAFVSIIIMTASLMDLFLHF